MFINVRDFGAIGTNATEPSGIQLSIGEKDTAAFKAAIEHIRSATPITESSLIDNSASGGAVESTGAHDSHKFSNTIYVPRGVYSIIEPLELPENCTLVGEGFGPSGSTLHGSHSGNAIIVIKSANVRIENIALIGEVSPWFGGPPETGILIHRDPATGSKDKSLGTGVCSSIENILIYRVNVEGVYRKAGIFSLGAERMVLDNVLVRPGKLSGAKYAFVSSSSNDDLAVSGFLPANPQSNGYSILRNCWFAIGDPNDSSDTIGDGWVTPYLSASVFLIDTSAWGIHDCYFSGKCSSLIDVMYKTHMDDTGPLTIMNIAGENKSGYNIMIRNVSGYVSTLHNLKIQGLSFACKYEAIVTQNVKLNGAHITGIRPNEDLDPTSPTYEDNKGSDFKYGNFGSDVTNSFIMAPDISKIRFLGTSSNNILL